MPDNQRNFERFIKQLKVSYSVLSGVGATPVEYGSTETIDISRSGVQLRLEESVVPPILLQMHIQVPGRAYGIFVLGKVIYCRPSTQYNNEYEAGIKFVGLLPPDLDQIIEKVVEQDALPEDFDSGEN